MRTDSREIGHIARIAAVNDGGHVLDCLVPLELVTHLGRLDASSLCWSLRQFSRRLRIRGTVLESLTWSVTPP
jgi:hypothetical protein